jgi:hypothetical protein
MSESLKGGVSIVHYSAQTCPDGAALRLQWVTAVHRRAAAAMPCFRTRQKHMHATTQTQVTTGAVTDNTTHQHDGNAKHLHTRPAQWAKAFRAQPATPPPLEYSRSRTAGIQCTTCNVSAPNETTGHRMQTCTHHCCCQPRHHCPVVTNA